jgi:predicted porin
MKLHNLSKSCLSVLAVAVAGTASAADLRINGFASFYYGNVVDNKEIPGELYRGYGETGNFQYDSQFGLQFASDLGDGLTATAQLTAEGRSEYDAELSWAFLKYQFNDEWSVRMGRQRVPFFLYSDFQKVGYAYSWVTPPPEVYNLGGLENTDGVMFEHLTDIGDFTSRLNFLFGSTSQTANFGERDLVIDNENQIGLFWDLTYDALTFHLTYTMSDLTISAYNDVGNGINQVLGGINPLTDDELDQLTVDEDKVTYLGAGLSGDWGTWVAAAEYANIVIDDSPTSSDRRAWYVFTGYRWDAYTLGLTYADYSSPNNDDTIDLLAQKNIEATLNAAAVGASDDVDAAGIEQLVEAIPGIYRAGEESSSVTVSLRYDYHPAAALKFEYTKDDVTRDPEDGSGEQDLSPSLVRVGVDLMF